MYLEGFSGEVFDIYTTLVLMAYILELCLMPPARLPVNPGGGGGGFTEDMIYWGCATTGPIFTPLVNEINDPFSNTHFRQINGLIRPFG